MSILCFTPNIMQYWLPKAQFLLTIRTDSKLNMITPPCADHVQHKVSSSDLSQDFSIGSSSSFLAQIMKENMGAKCNHFQRCMVMEMSLLYSISALLNQIGQQVIRC